MIETEHTFNVQIHFFQKIAVIYVSILPRKRSWSPIVSKITWSPGPCHEYWGWLRTASTCIFTNHHRVCSVAIHSPCIASLFVSNSQLIALQSMILLLCASSINQLKSHLYILLVGDGLWESSSLPLVIGDTVSPWTSKVSKSPQNKSCCCGGELRCAQTHSDFTRTKVCWPLTFQTRLIPYGCIRVCSLDRGRSFLCWQSPFMVFTVRKSRWGLRGREVCGVGRWSVGKRKHEAGHSFDHRMLWIGMTPWTRWI